MGIPMIRLRANSFPNLVWLTSCVLQYRRISVAPQDAVRAFEAIDWAPSQLLVRSCELEMQDAPDFRIQTLVHAPENERRMWALCYPQTMLALIYLERVLPKGAPQ